MTAAVIIVGDIGGTHTRLARVCAGQLEHTTRYMNREMGSLEACLEAFLNATQALDAPLDLRLALAAPIGGDEISLTNLDWHISARAIRARFDCRALTLINDFAALAYAIPAFGEGDLLSVGAGQALDSAPALILGPGTGFGASLYLPSGEVIATEAGHAFAAATTAEEAQVLGFLCADSGPVSIEQVVSGNGLLNLYRGVSARTYGGECTAERVFETALAGTDPVAMRALDLFFAFLGLAARNLALSTGARGGVYLAGGILPRYPQALAQSCFRRRFETPAPLSGYLEAIPTALVTHEAPALLGLARCLQTTA